MTCSWWHTVFKRFDKFHIGHLRFLIPFIPQCLLCHEALALIEWIIELTVSLPNLASCNQEVETLNNVWIPLLLFCKRREHGRFVNQNRGATDILAAVFPKRIDGALFVFCTGKHNLELIKLCFHCSLVCRPNIN